MRLLLDTHVVIWWFTEPRQLSAAAHGVVAGRGNLVMVSAVTPFEITHKHRVGRLPEAADLAPRIEEVLADAGFEALAIEFAHATLAGRLEYAHGDPFDRLLMAQALTENLVLVTADRVLRASGVPTLW